MQILLSFLSLFLIVEKDSSVLHEQNSSMKVSILANIRKNFTSYEISRHETPLFKIKAWKGGSGNNFFQLKNAIHWALCCNAVLEIPAHFAFPLPKVVNFSAFHDFHPRPFYNTLCTTGHTDIFYMTDRIGSVKPECSFDHVLVENYIIFNNSFQLGVPMMSFPCKILCGPEKEDVLTLFFRSGDIFNETGVVQKPPFTNYRQPSKHSYQQAINSRKWNRILFVTMSGPFLNSVWKYFFDNSEELELLGTEAIFISSTSVRDTLELLLNAVHLFTPVSSFTTMVREVSPVLKEYYTDMECKDIAYRVCHNTSAPNYYAKPLNSSQELYQWMVNYNPDDNHI